MVEHQAAYLILIVSENWMEHQAPLLGLFKYATIL
jgi:hypothetical protein